MKMLQPCDNKAFLALIYAPAQKCNDQKHAEWFFLVVIDLCSPLLFIIVSPAKVQIKISQCGYFKGSLAIRTPILSKPCLFCARGVRSCILLRTLLLYIVVILLSRSLYSLVTFTSHSSRSSHFSFLDSPQCWPYTHALCFVVQITVREGDTAAFLWSLPSQILSARTQDRWSCLLICCYQTAKNVYLFLYFTYLGINLSLSLPTSLSTSTHSVMWFRCAVLLSF